MKGNKDSAKAAALLASTLAFFGALIAQEDKSSQVYKTLEHMDALLFSVGFNACDLSQLEEITDDDFEFYHDQSGITSSKKAFLENTEKGICRLDYRPRRELVEGSLQVYPLKKDGVVYGAIQKGEHRFYAKYEGQEERLTSVAKFTHLWLLRDGNWRLSRVLSYDHKSPR